LSAVNMLQAAGYLMVFPWIPEAGDWGTGGVLRGADPVLPWQVGISATGLALTFASVFVLNQLLDPLLGTDGGERVSRRRVLAWVPYLLGSTLLIAGSLFNRLGPDSELGVFSTTVATLGGTIFLAYLPLFFDADFFRAGSRTDGPALPIRSSIPWLAAGAASVVLALAVMGPGVGSGFPEPHPLGR
ncbi:MAG: hypothetical protein ACYC8T_37930, partial [Myxococcaceae bacterium]